MTARSMRHLAGLAALADAYDGFIIDLWGVIHDGVTPYPGAIDCLQRLRAARKRVVLLSNAPRPAALVQEGLRGMGLVDSCYDGILTSGEVTRRLLRQRADPWFAALGRRMLHLGANKDRPLFEGLDLEVASHPAQADFILNTGPNDEAGESGPGPYLPLLRDCAAHRLPMLCANPDLVIVRGGARIICAGLLASCYAQVGGTARLIGKPHREVYDAVIPMLGVEPTRILAIGDALATDIAGAATAGIDSLWVLGGIHAEMIGDDHALAEAETASAGLAPVATLPGLRW